MPNLRALTRWSTPALLLVTCACSAEVRSHQADPAPAHAANSAQNGMQVYKDPATGEFTTPPAGAIAVTGQGAARTAPLAAQPSPGGGSMLQLNGRLRSYMTAIISPTGELKSQCILDGAAP